MSKLIVLTFIGNNVAAAPYQGMASQSIRVVPQADGSVGIRNAYTDSVLNLNNSNVWATSYTGNAWQSFRLVPQPDGSQSIQSFYSNAALAMTEYGTQSNIYAVGNRNQRFDLPLQADGSVGVRKVSRSLFGGTVDPFDAIKRVGNWFFNSSLQPTGFFLPPNTALNCELLFSGNIGTGQPTLVIGAPYANPNTLYAIPRLYPLKAGVNSVKDAGGGMIYLMLAGTSSYANLTMLSGAIETACFEHKKNTPAQFREMLAAWNQSPFAELISDRAIVTVSRSAALIYQHNDQNELMETYENIISIEDAVLGLDGSNALHTRPTLKHHLVLGNYGGGGYAHAGHGHTAYHENFAAELLTSGDLMGSWGVAHELGHQNQMLGYLPPDFIEVTTNIHSLAVQRAFSLPSVLTEKGSDGLDIWDHALNKLGTPNLSITDLNLYERLAALEQLRLAFGDQFWRNMNRTTRERWSSTGFWPDREKAFDNLAFYASITAQTDLREYFLAWGMPLSNACKEAIRLLNLPTPSVKPQILREPPSGKIPVSISPKLQDCTACAGAPETSEKI